ncbi:cyclic pyranopterin monophosphate synthase MoaC [Rhodopirellula bahusiensis]|uniref:Cyclic pyranopterin monophosphate synthase n=1 Tax=Rhodopirellula bahusiensis TaxID=2014065 RepID=A0A2G1WA98_9BACT|nr:cyclic pyranopterin monophosphate synthase MoaC [Rhodopirellula bahusiensis]PHQ35965.1 cyclic pyranopterin monophosphate synthase MoaC [Rhodopirellula bahusiensis]
MKPEPRSTHFNAAGEVHMVDVTGKDITVREAVASSMIRMSAEAAESIKRGDSKKGDVLAVARLAGISGAKWTSHLIPLCHAIPIEAVSIDFDWMETAESAEFQGSSAWTLRCIATARTTGKTGIEMEAMTAASTAALTVYDMLKSIDREMVIHQVRLESKSGGKSGVFLRESSE